MSVPSMATTGEKRSYQALVEQLRKIRLVAVVIFDGLRFEKDLQFAWYDTMWQIFPARGALGTFGMPLSTREILDRWADKVV